MRSFREKIKGREGLREIVEGLKKEGKRVCFTNGCFDLLHGGHVRYLEAARGKGDCLIVGGNSDALEAVDYVVPFAESDPFELISSLRPQVLVKGGDWDEREIVGRDVVEQTLVVPYIEGASTSGIIETILRRNAL